MQGPLTSERKAGRILHLLLAMTELTEENKIPKKAKRATPSNQPDTTEKYRAVLCCRVGVWGKLTNLSYTTWTYRNLKKSFTAWDPVACTRFSNQRLSLVLTCSHSYDHVIALLTELLVFVCDMCRCLMDSDRSRVVRAKTGTFPSSQSLWKLYCICIGVHNEAINTNAE